MSEEGDQCKTMNHSYPVIPCRSGYPAEPCLLRLICETNDSTLSENNGFLGNIVHIIFT